MNNDAPLDVVVSVVNTDNRELLRSCLASLPAAAGAGAGAISYETHLVDNASTDGSAEMVAAEFPSVRVLQNSYRRGFSANHNRVINDVVAAATARYVLVLNEDTELHPGALDALVRHCDEDPTVGIAGPVILGADGRRQPSTFAPPTVRSHVLRTLVPRLPAPAQQAGFVLNGSCLLIRCDAIKAAGTLDERFFIFFEDIDLGVRFARLGWRSVVCDSAVILHHGHQTVSQPALGSTMERQMLRSAYLFFQKHRGTAASWSVLWMVRAALAARAGHAFLASVARADPAERHLAQLLLNLIKYDPRHALSHERPSAAMPAVPGPASARSHV